MTDTRAELEEMTVEELQERARQAGVSGFSGMRKSELVDALTGTPSPQREGDKQPGEPGYRAGEDHGQREVASRLHEEQAQGYSGTVPDPTPNFNYTVAGNDEPTPETDPELAAEARKASGLRG